MLCTHEFVVLFLYMITALSKPSAAVWQRVYYRAKPVCYVVYMMLCVLLPSGPKTDPLY